MYSYCVCLCVRFCVCLRVRFCVFACAFLYVCVCVQDKQGEVKHVYRGSVFIQARNVLENAGIIVCRAKHLELAGTSNAMPVGGTPIPKSPRLHSPAPHRGRELITVCG